MSKILFVLFSVLLVAVVVLAEDEPKEKSCTPWLGQCYTYESCCRHLTCMSYHGKCVPVGGLVIPGQDKRPIGPGPFPPGYIA